MGDPEKYSRRRREQLAEERAQEDGDDPDPFGKLMASGAGRFLAWGCAPGSLSALLLLAAGVVVVGLVVQGC